MTSPRVGAALFVPSLAALLLLAAGACGRDPLDPGVAATPDAASSLDLGPPPGSDGARADTLPPPGRDSASSGDVAPSGAALVVVPGDVTVPILTTVRLSAVRTQNGRTEEVTNVVRWTLADATAGTLAPDATFTPRRAATAEITATLDGLSGRARVTAIAAVPLDLLVNPGQASLAVGGAQRFTATVRYNEGSQSDVTELATWAVDAANVASISNEPGQRGVVTARAPGAALITATALGLAAGRAQATVEGGSAGATVSISPTNPVRTLGTAITFSAETRRSGRVVDVTASAQWASSNLAVAPLLGNTATCRGTGSATITASYMGATAMTRLTCSQSAGRIVSLVVKPTELTVISGVAYKITAEAHHSDRNPRDVTASAEWASSNPEVVTVSAGQLTVYKAGSATLTATYEGQSARATVNALR